MQGHRVKKKKTAVTVLKATGILPINRWAFRNYALAASDLTDS
jgi:hypothetical protein